MRTRLFTSHYLFFLILALLVACQSSESKVAPKETDRSISTSQLINLLGDNNVTLIDVRTDEEIAAGMIPGAIHIDVNAENFSQQIQNLDKSLPVVTYCRSGGRAQRACDELSDLGFNEVYNYGGYTRWLDENKQSE